MRSDRTFSWIDRITGVRKSLARCVSSIGVTTSGIDNCNAENRPSASSQGPEGVEVRRPELRELSETGKPDRLAPDDLMGQPRRPDDLAGDVLRRRLGDLARDEHLGRTAHPSHLHSNVASSSVG